MKNYAWLVALTCGLAVMMRGAEAPSLAGSQGAMVTLAEGATGWRLGGLTVPGGPPEGLALAEQGVEVATEQGEQALTRGWALVEASEGKIVLEQAAAEAGVRLRRVISFGPATNVLRIETWARAVEGTRKILRIGLLTLEVAGETFRETGRAPMSFPVFGEGVFAGIEHISGEARAKESTVELVQRPSLTVTEEWRPVATAVVGWPLPGAERGLPDGARMRVAFLHYLDTVRVKPERMVLHSETWWTMMPPLKENEVLADIEALKRGFLDRTGMFFDTYCLDLGWSAPKTFWEIAGGQQFPNGFRAVNERLNGLGAKLGLWMSPGSGYPDGLSNEWLRAQGYEMLPFEGFPAGVPCFALGTRYQREFKERLVSYAQQYGLGHAILDFMPQRCDVPGHGHPVGEESRYAIDAGVADVLDGLRAVNPQIALEPMVCGYPPSPWWLTKTPFILGPAGDDVPYGRVPCPEWMESLITARDVAYRAGQEAWLMPTQALETWDIVVQTPGDFQNTAVMAIGRGRWFLSSYIKPSLMTPEDWDFFAALVRWARANKEFLGNAWQIGGNPEHREAYGFMFRNAEKDVFCVRNPWIEERTIELPVAAAEEARELRMIYPRRTTFARWEPGAGPIRVRVGAYETLILETVPAGEAMEVEQAREGATAGVVAGTPHIEMLQKPGEQAEFTDMRFAWTGQLATPEVDELELCVLVEGSASIEHATTEILLGGQVVKARRTGSAGQFGAASDAARENWAWFLAPVPKGQMAFNVEVRVPSADAAVSVYLRGTIAARNDAAPEAGAVFPTFRPERQAWSQTLLAAQRLDAAALR